MESQVQAFVENGLKRVEDRLLQELSYGSAVLDQITSHLAAAGGKRMRPALTLLVAQIGQPGQEANEEVVAAATSVELTHLATLYHDDVMDGAPVRRGTTAVQEQWNNSMAILAGDIIFARASRIVADLGPRSVAQHSDTFERLCVGQMHETIGPDPQDDPVEFYINVLANKTGSLVACAAQYGAELSGCSDEIIEAVKVYGEKVGIAFQLADDVLDLVADGATSGKTPGTDLREGVKTMPVLLLEGRLDANLADKEDAKLLADLRGDLSSDAALADVVGRLASHEVVDDTRQMARRWVEEAIAALEVVPAGAAKDALIEFAQMQVDRLS